MGESGILEENAHSRQVAVKALGATVPAWIQCGNSSEQLWNIAMSFMEATQPEHRVTILSSILQAVPQVCLLAFLYSKFSCLMARKLSII